MVCVHKKADRRTGGRGVVGWSETPLGGPLTPVRAHFCLAYLNELLRREQDPPGIVAHVRPRNGVGTPPVAEIRRFELSLNGIKIRRSDNPWLEKIFRPIEVENLYTPAWLNSAEGFLSPGAGFSCCAVILCDPGFGRPFCL